MTGPFLTRTTRCSFSCERFVRDIAEGNCCFICGATPAEKPFNNEHVLPNWVLRRYGLHTRTITLPNETTFRYDQYTIPCCIDCNSLLGRNVEEPIRKLIEQGPVALREYVRSGGALHIFVWLALIFLKIHLKDRTLRWHRDLRQPDDRIGELYTWEDLHHLHTVARCFYTKCDVSDAALGSLLIMGAKRHPDRENFDIADFSEAQSLTCCPLRNATTEKPDPVPKSRSRKVLPLCTKLRSSSCVMVSP